MAWNSTSPACPPAPKIVTFSTRTASRWGTWAVRLIFTKCASLGLADEWLGLRVSLRSNRPTHFWARPLETVSQSEGGFELVHQAVSLLPHWYVQGDAEGRWSVTLVWELDTSQAEARRQPSPEAVVVT